MIAQLAGVVSIALGILWILKPEWLRARMLGKANRWVFWLALCFVFFPLFHLGGKLGLGGVILVFVIFWMGMKRAWQGVNDAGAKLPLPAFQAVGLVQVLAGVALLVTH